MRQQCVAVADVPALLFFKAQLFFKAEGNKVRTFRSYEAILVRGCWNYGLNMSVRGSLIYHSHFGNRAVASTFGKWGNETFQRRD